MKVLKIIGIVIAVIWIIGLFMPNENNSTNNNSSGNNVQDAVATQSDIELLQDNAKWTPDVEGAITIHCVCQNNSSELKQYVEIDASFYDKNGKIVGTAMGNTTNFAAHSKRTIDVQGMDIYGEGITYQLEIKDGAF